MIPRQLIVERAQGWKDTPFRHQGRRKHAAVDCVGLIVGVGYELGVQAPIPDDYPEHPSPRLILRYADRYLTRVEKDWLAPGCIAFLWGFTPGEMQHMGIVGQHAGRLTLIHATSKRGKVVEHSWDDFWLRRLVRVYEYPNTEPLEG